MPTRGVLVGCASAASGASVSLRARLRVRLTASPTNRILPGSLAERRDARQPRRPASFPAPETLCSRRRQTPMEEMSVAPGAPGSAQRGTSPSGSGPRDLRDWIARVEAIGQLKRISEEVGRDEEMGAITYMAHQEIGAPALPFERIKGSPKGFRPPWNPLGPSADRFALAIGEPAGLPVMELIQRCKTKFASPIPPVVVEGEGTPVNENHLRDDKVDIRNFPAARHWPRDGGEYIGTCDAVITRDPDGGWLNVGCYRQMVQGKNEVGLYLSPGKDARLHIERYWSRNEPCEVVCCWGIDPALFIAASQTFPKTVSELDFVGAMLGRPVEIVKGEATDRKSVV